MNAKQITSIARSLSIAVAIALFAGGAGVNAQETGSAKGGATKLLQLYGRQITPKAEPSQYKPMACAMCRNDVVEVRDTDSKGGGRALLSGTPLIPRLTLKSCKVHQHHDN